MANNFTVQDNTDIILSKIKAATQEGMRKAAKIAVDSVQYQILYGYKDPHGRDGHTEIVDTGELFDSIEGEVKRVSQNAYTLVVGTNKKYAGFVHNGTRKLKARRFITDGVLRVKDEIPKAIKSSLQNG